MEKPFGKDLDSSRELQAALEPDWKEEEIYRIDHYLGKEMVKNILILRFGNEFFGATWNRNHIDNVQVGGMSTIEGLQLIDARSRSRSRSAQRDAAATLTNSASSAMSCRTVSALEYPFFMLNRR